jgi:hypothetical protein
MTTHNMLHLRLSQRSLWRVLLSVKPRSLSLPTFRNNVLKDSGPITAIFGSNSGTIFASWFMFAASFSYLRKLGGKGWRYFHQNRQWTSTRLYGISFRQTVVFSLRMDFYKNNSWGSVLQGMIGRSFKLRLVLGSRVIVHISQETHYVSATCTTG